MGLGNQIKSDTVKFSVRETKILLTAYETNPELYRLIDSCESELTEIRSIIKNDSIENYACDHVNNTQNFLIGKQQDEIESLRKESKKENRLIVFWKSMTGTAILSGVGYSIYKEIKN